MSENGYVPRLTAGAPNPAVHMNWFGCVAQLVEQLTLNQRVWGSSPHPPTIFSL